MPSAAGKRVGRVLVGCSKPEAGDKPGSYTWQVILDEITIGQQDDVLVYVSCNRHEHEVDIDLTLKFMKVRHLVHSRNTSFYVDTSQIPHTYRSTPATASEFNVNLPMF